MEGTDKNPISIKLVGQETKPVTLFMVGLLSIAPVIVAILMQNPGLRQAIKMRSYYYARIICGKNAQYWRKLETIADHRYDLSRL